MKQQKPPLLHREEDISRIIEMAWEDRTPFEAIEKLYGYSEKHVIQMMRVHLSHNGFKRWRARVSHRVTKHAKLRPAGIDRAYCTSQYKIRANKR